MSLIATTSGASDDGGIADAADQGTGTRPSDHQAGPSGPPWGRAYRHQHRWDPPEWSAGNGSSSYRGWDRHGFHRGMRGLRGLRLKNLRRSPDARVLGGVCGAVSRATGIDVTYVRIGTVLVSVASVVFIFIYALAWLIVPMEG